MHVKICNKKFCPYLYVCYICNLTRSLVVFLSIANNLQFVSRHLSNTFCSLSVWVECVYNNLSSQCLYYKAIWYYRIRQLNYDVVDQYGTDASQLLRMINAQEQMERNREINREQRRQQQQQQQN